MKVGSVKLKNVGSVKLPWYFTVSVMDEPSASLIVGRVRLVVNPTAILRGPKEVEKVGALLSLTTTEKTVIGEFTPSEQVTSMG